MVQVTNRIMLNLTKALIKKDGGQRENVSPEYKIIQFVKTVTLLK